MSVPPLVAELMQRFEQHRDGYVQSQYKEAQLRADFIDPFFEGSSKTADRACNDD